MRWEDFEDPEYDPAEASRAAAEAPVAAPADGTTHVSGVRIQEIRPRDSVKLGPKGIVSEGRVGRIHTVVVGYAPLGRAS